MSTLQEADDGPIFEHAASINAAIGSTCANWNKEHLNFLRRRSAEDTGFPSKLGSCKMPVERAQAYITFLLTALHDYRSDYAVRIRIALHRWSAQCPGTASV